MATTLYWLLLIVLIAITLTATFIAVKNLKQASKAKHFESLTNTFGTHIVSSGMADLLIEDLTQKARQEIKPSNDGISYKQTDEINELLKAAAYLEAKSAKKQQPTKPQRGVRPQAEDKEGI